MKFRKIHYVFVFLTVLTVGVICGVDYFLRNRLVDRYFQEFRIAHAKVRHARDRGKEASDEVKKTHDECLKKLMDLRFYDYRKIALKYVTYSSGYARTLAEKLDEDLALTDGFFAYRSILEGKLEICLWAKPEQMKKFVATIRDYEKELQEQIRKEKDREERVKNSLDQVLNILENELPRLSKKDVDKREYFQRKLELALSELTKQDYFRYKVITPPDLVYSSPKAKALKAALAKTFSTREAYFKFNKTKQRKLLEIYMWIQPAKMSEALAMIDSYRDDEPGLQPQSSDGRPTGTGVEAGGKQQE